MRFMVVSLIIKNIKNHLAWVKKKKHAFSHLKMSTVIRGKNLTNLIENQNRKQKFIRLEKSSFS